MKNTVMADTLFFNGVIHTFDADDSVTEAIAIKDGVIIAVGTNSEINCFSGEDTRRIDLQKKMLMPGIIDSHLHAIWGGKQLLSFSLEYQSLTVEETLNKIQSHLDRDALKGEDDWLTVRAWLRCGMIPAGADITRAALDSLNTRRPVVLFSNDCHTLVANSRALTLLGIDETSPEPADGKYYRSEDGLLNGIIDDAPAMRAYDSITSLNQEQSVHLADVIQRALNAQGVTTVMDARVYTEHLDYFHELKQQNRLHIRFMGAKEVTPTDALIPTDADAVIGSIAELAEKYNTRWSPAPDVSLCNVKFFIDGVLQPPMMTGSLREPYLENKGTEQIPDWQPSERYGDLYFKPDILNALFVSCAKAGLHPHTHTMTDGAIEMVLNAIEEMRSVCPDSDIRPTLAHNEYVGSDQYPRYKALNATVLLAFQWAGVTPELMQEEQNILGIHRFQNLETAGKFIDRGIRVAFGSDWPIDPLNEWYDFQVGVTRQAHLGNEIYTPRLETDRNLTLKEVLRAATIDAAYVTHKEQYIGSLEKGKFADLIVLDQNVFDVDPHSIKDTRIMLTMVGGEIVYTPEIE